MTTTASKISIELDSDALDTLYRVATCAAKKHGYHGQSLEGVYFAARRGKLMVAATTSKVLALGTVPGVVLDEGESWHLVLESGPFLELGKGSKRAREAREGVLEVDSEGKAWLWVDGGANLVKSLGSGYPDFTCILPKPGAKPRKALGDVFFRPEFYGQAFYAVADKGFDPCDLDAAVRWCQYHEDGPVWLTCRARPHLVAAVMPIIPDKRDGTTIAGVPEELLADLRS